MEVSIVDKENVVECSVSDTGLGISDEDLPKVFNKFDQFGREFESAEKGTGLGLAISKGIIELHRGKIWAESTLGEGTKISFTLPKYSPRELFKEQVADGLAKAIVQGASLSVIIFEVKNYETLRNKLGQDKIASVMDNLGQPLKASLRSRAEISVRDRRAILVALPETDKKSALSIVEKYKSRINDYLSKEGLAKEIELDLRVASFPEDAQTEEELINKVRLQEDIKK
jgi:GGDEF domain-containing protein